jgi:hypothetical protein
VTAAHLAAHDSYENPSTNTRTHPLFLRELQQKSIFTARCSIILPRRGANCTAELGLFIDERVAAPSSTD